MSTRAYEIWADEGLPVPYILLLWPVEGGFQVLDPAKGNRKVFESKDYQEVRLWLLEDEYVLVGRKEFDDG